MKLKHLSNNDLHSQTKSIAEKERLSTIEVLWHLRENERRMLYAQMGYRDLKEYCVKELKYSEGSSWRRIGAMRLLQELPEVENKIQTGELNLTQISLAKAHFREVKSTMEEKQEILASIENQSSKMTERLLAERKPDGLIEKRLETERPLRGQKTEVTFVIDKQLQKDLEEIQVLLGKRCSKLELFKLMTEKTFQSEVASDRGHLVSEKHDRMPRSRYISTTTTKEVKSRDQYRCQYVNQETKKQCEAKHYLQIDHKTPYAKQGANTQQNLQLLCSTHNRLRAVKEFGIIKMQQYLPSLRE